MATFLDTNVIVYAFDRSEPERRARAHSILATPPDELVVSAQVLAEFYTVAATRLQPVVPPVAAASAVMALSELRVIPSDQALVASAIETSQAAGISFWEAQIIEAAAIAGCETILTEDLSHGQVIRGVQIVNPFV